METPEFKRILTTFAEKPADVDVSKGNLTVQIGENIIEAKLIIEDGNLCILENDEKYSAKRWIVNRIARIDLLANRILNYIVNQEFFINPSGKLLDDIERSPKEEEKQVDDALVCLQNLLDLKTPGDTSIFYLTSDAGEGKTTIINQFARHQAQLYREKEKDWLLIPISLGGRPFLRFDDIVIAALVNHYRFQNLYYESFLELVKLGVIVPAFDGFEEMFIEGSSGEAISALGNLVKSLNSQGNILIASRKAYFEYKSLDTQAKLFDTLHNYSVTFARLELNRWTKEQFINFSQKRGIKQPDRLYSEVGEILTYTHPILTRPVLIKRLIDLAESFDGHQGILNKLGKESSPHRYFSQFVESIIEREARDKWIDRQGETAKALISINEHHLLLSFIAQEMWINRSDSINTEIIEVIVDIFCDNYKKSAIINRQIKERIKQHALIVTNNEIRGSFSFDHEEFKNYYLGYSIGRLIEQRDISDFNSIMRISGIQQQTADSAVFYLQENKIDRNIALKHLIKLAMNENTASFIRENCGALAIRLLDGVRLESNVVLNLSFPIDSLHARSLTDFRFSNCYFQGSSLKKASITNCIFDNCIFERLELADDFNSKDNHMNNCNIRALLLPNSDSYIFDPKSIKQILSDYKLSSQDELVEEARILIEPDEELKLTERVLRIFTRKTQVTENIIKLRCSDKATFFENSILPKLLSANILKKVQYMGQGRQLCFQLNIFMSQLENALSSCNGRFDDFLTKASSFTRV